MSVQETSISTEGPSPVILVEQNLFSKFTYVQLMRQNEPGEFESLVIMGHFNETADMMKKRFETACLEIPAYDETITEALGFVPAILLVNRASLTENDAKMIREGFSNILVQLDNDVYKKISACGKPGTGFSTCKMNLIYPASKAHIKKYTHSPLNLIEETERDYQEVTLPYISKVSVSRLKWIHNLFSRETVDPSTFKEKVLFDDDHPTTGFILVTDYKWDERNTNELYCLAICRRNDLRTIRDLNEEHLPLLRYMYEKIPLILHQTYKIDSRQLRLYFHYHPTYYHLHVHCVHVNTKVHSGFFADKAHLLKDVIENIELFSHDYYRRKTLSFIASAEDDLYRLLMDHRKTRDV